MINWKLMVSGLSSNSYTAILKMWLISTMSLSGTFFMQVLIIQNLKKILGKWNSLPRCIFKAQSYTLGNQNQWTIILLLSWEGWKLFAQTSFLADPYTQLHSRLVHAVSQSSKFENFTENSEKRSIGRNEQIDWHQKRSTNRKRKIWCIMHSGRATINTICTMEKGAERVVLI